MDSDYILACGILNANTEVTVGSQNLLIGGVLQDAPCWVSGYLWGHLDPDT